MNCKHVRVKGKTTKYYYCMLKNKTVDDYSCRNCVMKLPYIGQKGFVGIVHYSRATYRDQVYKKSFDLCASCEKKFRRWLKEKEIPTTSEIIDRFPIYEEA